MGAEDGTVWKYELETGQMDKLLVRCALPVRDLSLSKDGDWVAVASEYAFFFSTLIPPKRSEADCDKMISVNSSSRLLIFTI